MYPYCFATKLNIAFFIYGGFVLNNYCTVDTLATENERGSGVEPELMLEWLGVIVVRFP